MRYGEGVFVGYRGLQKLGNRLSYPFGHGLAYTTFEFTDLRAEVSEVTPETGLDEVVLTVSFTVVNTGGRRGVAVPQLYLGYLESSVDRPSRELRGFQHLELGPGESFHAEIRVTRRDLSFWDVRTHSWSVELGKDPCRAWGLRGGHQAAP